MASVSIDDVEVRRLAVDLGRSASRVLPLVKAAVDDTAKDVEADLNEQAASSTHFKGMAGSVTSDPLGGFGFIGREVGPVIGRGGGSLGGIFFIGGANGGGGTGDLDGAVKRAEGPLSSALGDVLGGVL